MSNQPATTRRFRFSIGFLLKLMTLCAFVMAGWLYLDIGGAQLAFIAALHLWLGSHLIRRFARGRDRDPFSLSGAILCFVLAFISFVTLLYCGWNLYQEFGPNWRTLIEQVREIKP